MRWRIIILVALCCGNVSRSSRILGIFPTETKSHYIMYGKILHALAERGHNVTVVTHFPGLYKATNYNELSIKGVAPLPGVDIEYILGLTDFDNVFDVINTSIDACKKLLKYKPVLDLVNEKYDLVVVEMFACDCFLSIPYKMKVPVVGIVSSVTLPWVNDMMANPDTTSYIHSYFYPFTQRMTFAERLSNTILTWRMKHTYHYESSLVGHKIAEEAFGPLPSLEDMAKNISMILVNSHYSLSQIKPWVPQMVEVGGLHIEDKINPLPKDISNFMDNFKNGVVFFSFGTIFPIDSIHDKKLSAFIKVFDTLNLGVIWKSNMTDNLHKNIMRRNWLPQIPILCNPSTKLFISHGGLLGLQEAVYCGVPILGIPFFADQRFNLMALQEKGISRVLHYDDINEQTLLENIKILITDKSYREKAQLHSKTFKDRPIHPLNLSVYWMEYVLRYNGAEHLKSPALELKWYQYNLLDVYLVLAVGPLLVLIIIYKSIVYLLKRCSKQKTTNNINNNKKKK